MSDNSKLSVKQKMALFASGQANNALGAKTVLNKRQLEEQSRSDAALASESEGKNSVFGLRALQKQGPFNHF